MSGSRNPFRTPVATPIPTGASISSTVPPSYTSAPPPSFSSGSSPPSYSDDDDDEVSPEALPELTPRIPSGRPPQVIAQNTGSSQSTPPSLPPRPSSSTPGPPLPSNRPQTDDLLSTDGIPESAPPAYSVTPNVGGGELVVEQGPRRPFQRAPEPLLQLSTPPSQQQQQGQQQHLQPPQPRPPQFAPPPGTPPSGRPNSQLSDFAQDFYNSGGATTPPPASQQQSQQPRYAPPPGPPPPTRPRPASTSSGAGSTAPPASDGRPTTTPTPGHPLLRNGKTLIYPEGYLCQKCTFPYPVSHLLLTHIFREQARIRATRTMTRLTHVASAGIVLASYLRPFSPRAPGVTRLAGQRARASVVAHSSARCPHSNLRKCRRSLRPHSQCLAATHILPRGQVPHNLCRCLCHLEVCPRQARLLSCRVTHVSVDDCAGGVGDAARPRS